MNTVGCSTHGDLVLELARGMLEAEKAAFAESVRHSCQHCSGWWRENLEGAARRPVDQGVAAGLAAFQPWREPARRHHGYVAAAAVVLLALGVMVLTPAPEDRRASETDQAISAAAESVTADLIRSEDFESGGSWEVVGGVYGAESTLDGAAGNPVESEGQEVIFRDGLEEGGFGAWSRHS